MSARLIPAEGEAAVEEELVDGRDVDDGLVDDGLVDNGLVEAIEYTLHSLRPMFLVVELTDAISKRRDRTSFVGNVITFGAPSFIKDCKATLDPSEKLMEPLVI